MKEGKVDPDAGYWDLTKLEIKTGGIFSTTIKSEEYIWTYTATVPKNLASSYTGDCDCGCGTRPDEAYWTGVFD